MEVMVVLYLLNLPLTEVVRVSANQEVEKLEAVRVSAKPEVVEPEAVKDYRHTIRDRYMVEEKEVWN